jgi:hypothetical protein
MHEEMDRSTYLKLRDAALVTKLMNATSPATEERIIAAFDAAGIIQGISRVVEYKNARFINFLVTNPNNLLPDCGARKVDGVGSALIAAISKTSSDLQGKELRVNALKSPRGFYEHLGFEKIKQAGKLTKYRLSHAHEELVIEKYGNCSYFIKDMTPYVLTEPPPLILKEVFREKCIVELKFIARDTLVGAGLGFASSIFVEDILDTGPLPSGTALSALLLLGDEPAPTARLQTAIGVFGGGLLAILASQTASPVAVTSAGAMGAAAGGFLARRFQQL